MAGMEPRRFGWGSALPVFVTKDTLLIAGHADEGL